MDRVKYTVDKEGYTEVRFLVVRRNRIGQGRVVTSYVDRSVADEVAEFLNSHVDDEERF